MGQTGTERALRMVLRQEASSAEARAIAHACMLLDVPCMRCEIEELEERGDAIRAGDILPVGSVEYLREAFRVAGVPEPAPMSYPRALDWFLKREVTRTRASEVTGGQFVKPVATKLFTGFVVPADGGQGALSDDDAEQWAALQQCGANEPVYVAERVTWLSEWRVYVRRGMEIGRARYDQAGDDEAPEPDWVEVKKAIGAMGAEAGCPVAYSLDVGVMGDTQSALVEVNDAFALGLYGKALVPGEYLGILWDRWQQVMRRS